MPSGPSPSTAGALHIGDDESTFPSAGFDQLPGHVVGGLHPLADHEVAPEGLGLELVVDLRLEELIGYAPEPVSKAWVMLQLGAIRAQLVQEAASQPT